MNHPGTIARTDQVRRPPAGWPDRSQTGPVSRRRGMSGGIQVDMEALERVGHRYALAAGQLREVLGGLDAQVSRLLHAIASYDMSSTYDYFTGVRGRVALTGP